MSYTNYTEVVERYPLMKTWGDIESHVSSLAWFAEHQLNGMLAGTYSVPFSDTPYTIKDITIDLTYYKALATRDPAKAEKLEKYVLGRIERIAKGDEKLLTTSGDTIATTGAQVAVWSNIGCFHPVHSMLDADASETGISSMRTSYEVDERDE